MSERLMIIVICCTTVLLLGVSACLTVIALTHDGTNEGLIVTALIGVPAFIITTASGLIGHYMGAQAGKGTP